MRRHAQWILLLALIAGCAAEPKPRQLTERERHEAIAKSPLPGAPVVGRALVVSDSSASRAKTMQAQFDATQSTTP